MERSRPKIASNPSPFWGGSGDRTFSYWPLVRSFSRFRVGSFSRETVKDLGRGNRQAKYSESRPVTPNKWSLERNIRL
jgi:hypothetical protein